MAVLTHHSRTTFWAGVRALFAVDFGFAPFITVHAHLLGFGFNVIHYRGGGRLMQFSVTLSVPFYIAGFYYLPQRAVEPQVEKMDAGYTVVEGKYVSNGILAARRAQERSADMRRAKVVQQGIDEREGRADFFLQREGLVEESKDGPA